MGIIYFGILLCSIAFAIGVIYISFVLKRVANVTTSLGTSVTEVEQQFKRVAPHLKKNIQETGKTVDELKDNLKATDSLFDTVQNVGKSMIDLSDTYKNYKESVPDEQFQRQLKPVVEGIKWAEATNQIVSKWENNGRKEE